MGLEQMRNNHCRMAGLLLLGGGERVERVTPEVCGGVGVRCQVSGVMWCGRAQDDTNPDTALLDARKRSFSGWRWCSGGTEEGVCLLVHAGMLRAAVRCCRVR